MTTKEKTSNPKGLGRGLSALLGSTDKEYADISAGNVPRDRELPIEFLVPNPYQPRFYFDEQKSADLIQSIKDRGILQPLLVRQRGDLDEYEIIAGERRWRASQAAGLHRVPVIIREMTDGEALEIALIENIQRHDLSPIEEALGYKRLMEEFNHTQEQLGHIVGKSRSHIANILRLLALPETVQALVGEGKLSMGHARALITVEDADAVAQRILNEGLSVRQVEAISKKSKGITKPRVKTPAVSDVYKLDKDADTLALENDLSLALGLKVSIEFNNDESGELRLHYKTLEQLDDVCQRLSAREGF
ncbi:ParB/RepB/Spo0J family partition protein [Paremcibacter congregatus]|uniref:ParB/RepB/Spo0J family partition protein n=1 Tax=Paremcibacter congregatus TaxID=2043170 RepID=UPI0030EC6EC5|tara:strand:+ start:15703 stop:16620 length:918 start_codon:yes stop_codon:yes gene_type:complete